MLVQHAQRAGGDGNLFADVDESRHAHGDAVKRRALAVDDVRERLVERFHAVDRRGDGAGDAHPAILEHHVTREECADLERKNAPLRSHIAI